MKKVNYEELESIIRDYANSKTISKPLLVFGNNYQDARIQIVKSLFGDVNSWKITFDDDSPRPDISYCLYDVYLGDDNSNAILRNCMSMQRIFIVRYSVSSILLQWRKFPLTLFQS